MKKTLSLAILTALLLSLLTGCGAKKGYTIAIPNDTTNESRALQLLEANGFIKLKDGVGITATILDIQENPHNITFQEMEAAQLPRILKEVDYAVINSNYAISGGLNPIKDALTMEGTASHYGNILCVKEGNETSPKIRALAAALLSQKVADFITEKYEGSVVSLAENPTDGYDPNVDYAALAGETIKIAASPVPHAEILELAKDILAEKDITLEIFEYEDYVLPNEVVESGEMDANYFQHVPYLEDFNAQKGTHLVSAAVIHVEPLGIYGGKQTSLDPLK